MLHKSLPSVSVFVCVYPIVARQRLSKNVTAAMITHATIKELLDQSLFYVVRLVSRNVAY
jgi:hypothetical protein